MYLHVCLVLYVVHTQAKHGEPIRIQRTRDMYQWHDGGEGGEGGERENAATITFLAKQTGNKPKAAEAPRADLDETGKR